jgi:hypothetical protein
MPEWNFKKWYEEHGSELNQTRKDRYKTDPTYKTRVLEANRASRKRKRELLLTERTEERSVQKVKPSKRWKEVSLTVNGTEQTLVTIGALASLLDRSKLGIRLLEKRGVIPSTPHRNKAKERLYTPAQIEEIRKILASKGMLERKNVAVMPEYVTARVKLSDASVVETFLFRIGILASAVGRSTITLEQMERRGAIPPTPLKLPPNRRVFTADQIEVVRAAFERRGGDLRGSQDKEALFDEIMQGWKDAKVVGATILERAQAVPRARFCHISVQQERSRERDGDNCRPCLCYRTCQSHCGSGVDPQPRQLRVCAHLSRHHCSLLQGRD